MPSQKSKEQKAQKRARGQRRRKQETTQWTAQFLVASELARRGYTVAFTMGNHTPFADLMVGSPKGHFWVDVKGLATNNSWHLKPKTIVTDLYYVLVRVVSPVERRKNRGNQDQFFVLSQKSANALVRKYQKRTKRKSIPSPGFNFRFPEDHLDRWDCLPNAG